MAMVTSALAEHQAAVVAAASGKCRQRLTTNRSQPSSTPLTEGGGAGDEVLRRKLQRRAGVAQRVHAQPRAVPTGLPHLQQRAEEAMQTDTDAD